MNVNQVTLNTPVGQLVAQRPGRSRVFEQFGIDFCCGGKKSLQEVCRTRNLDPDEVLAALMNGDEPPADVDPGTLGLSDLCDHIENTHHLHLKQELPRLQRLIEKVATAHGGRFPWMLQVRQSYGQFMEELLDHMFKEEHLVFPMLRRLERDGHVSDEQAMNQSIRLMEQEHEGAGTALSRLRELTDGFMPPADACNTFRAALDALRELELDMHQHVHKENNILFARAMQKMQATAAAEA